VSGFSQTKWTTLKGPPSTNACDVLGRLCIAMSRCDQQCLLSDEVDVDDTFADRVSPGRLKGGPRLPGAVGQTFAIETPAIDSCQMGVSLR
jgi:hypothetical protein